MKLSPQSAGNYRPGAAALAGLAGLAVALVAVASPGDASPRPEAAPGPLRIGMNSCAARGCHGAVEATDPGRGQVYIKDGSYTTWLHYDPHARAYAVLLEPRSKAIAARLEGRLADKSAGPLGGKPAHEAGLCLSCHATPEAPPAKVAALAPASDGISCEACHGPAEAWQDKHLSAAWRDLPGAKKAADGYADLSTPSARAKVCVGCHVGDRSRGMDMNHDLIAAGHPRLNFEFATYQAAYPKHWKEEGDPAEFEAKSWAVGQVITADAMLGLLSARALASREGASRVAPAPEAVWPEFSEYECFACHHDLTNPSPRQKPGHSSGRPAWETWPSSMLGELAGGLAAPAASFVADGSPLGRLRDEMGHAIPDVDRVAELASLARSDLGRLLASLESGGFDRARVEALMKVLASRRSPASEGWDRAAQEVLALEALARAARGAGRAVDPAVGRAIREGSEALDFPPDYDSPRGTSSSKRERATRPSP